MVRYTILNAVHCQKSHMTLVPKQRELDDQVQILPSLFQSWSTSDMRCVVAEFLNVDCYHKLQR